MSDKKVAFITGGSRGIGRAVAIAFANRDFNTLIINYLEKDRQALNLQQSLEKQNVEVILAKYNIADPRQVAEMFAMMKDHVAHINVFVHCAALTSFKPIIEIKPNQWDIIVNTNARSFLQCAQYAAKIMQEGSIVAVSSLGSFRVMPNYGALGPTKAALECVVKYLAVELATKNIRVNGVCGGLVESDAIKHFPDFSNLCSQVVTNTPGGRLAKPEDIADVVVFLTSPAARWIYGQNIVADGGYSL